MIKSIFSLILGLIAIPLTVNIFKILSINLENGGFVLITFFFIFTLISLGIYFILRKIFGILFFIGIIFSLILMYKGII